MGAPVSPRGTGKRRLNAEMNVVPYIDVMLVLLIIFMVTAPLLTQGVEVELPDATAESMSSQDKNFIVTVDRDGQIFLSIEDRNDGPLSEEELVAKAGALVRANPQVQQLFLVRGDAKADYENVARAMARLQEAGVKKIGFITEPASRRPNEK